MLDEPVALAPAALESYVATAERKSKANKPVLKESLEGRKIYSL